MKKENDPIKAYKATIKALENKKLHLVKQLEDVEAVIATLGKDQEIFVYKVIFEAINSGKSVRNLWN